MHFSNVTAESPIRGIAAAAMVDGAQGLESGGGCGDQAVGCGGFGGVQQVFEEIRGDGRHIAGNDQIPVRMRGAQRGEDPAKRTTTVDLIRKDGITQPLVSLRRTDERRASGSLTDSRGNVLEQRRAVHRQQRFIAAHAGAAPAHQHETGTHRAQAAHEMIIAYAATRYGDAQSGDSPYGDIVVANKKLYICLIMACAMLAASPMRAADPPVAAPAELAGAKTLVVRADRRTGRLVRKVVVPDAATPAKMPTAEVSALVEQSARTHQVDPLLVHSIIQVESDYNLYAISPKGAEGLMQLTPSTARMLGVSNSFDPGQNIEAGVKYLKYLQSVYKDDRLALAAYNAGPGAVDKYNQVPPYPETQEYVNRVGKRYGEARRAAAAKSASDAASAGGTTPMPVNPAPQPQTVEERHPRLEQFIDENGRLHLRTVE
jgi:soluble lytic murein transglycosylase-like protein